MKLALVCNGFVKSGGMERYTLDLVNAFHELQQPIPLLFSKKFDFSLPEINHIQPFLIPCSFLPHRLRNYYVSWRLSKLKKSLSVDVLIGCGRCSCTDIVCCGGTHSGYLETKKKRSLYDRAELRFEKAQYKHAKHVVAHSNLMRDEIIRYFDFDPEKISVLYPPVDLASFRREALGVEDSSAVHLFNPQGKTTFLFVSSSHHRKGFELLSHFFESTDLPIEMIVAGRRLPEKRTYRNIRYIGYQKDMASLYRMCDYSILASSYEPFGLAPVESVCCGTPVVIADNFGCCEVLSEQAMITFSRRDVHSLETAIEKACREKEGRKKACLTSKLEDLVFYDPSPVKHARALLEIASSI